MKIVSRRRPVETVSFQLVFEYTGKPGSGFAFDCDEAGNPAAPSCDAARDNLAACLAGSIDGRPVERKGVRRDVHRYTEPAVGLCDSCSRRVVLASTWANECDCGVEYNGSGQRLAPRSQWGEETGEVF